MYTAYLSIKKLLVSLGQDSPEFLLLPWLDTSDLIT